MRSSNHVDSSSYDSDKSIWTLLKQKYKSQYTQTVDMKRRKTYIGPITEVNEAEPVGAWVPTEAGLRIFIDEEVNLGDEQMRSSQVPSKLLSIPTFRDKHEDEFTLEHRNSMDFYLAKQRGKRKRANSFDKNSKLAKQEVKNKQEEISKVLEDNRKLEEQIEQMQKYSKENEELRHQLSTAKSKLTEQEQRIINEKDQKINELAQTLSEREEKYKSLLKDFAQLKGKLDKESDQEAGLEKLIGEKEQELEKINFMNASYRAQLIELKISMSKARDASRLSHDNDDFAVKVNNPLSALEEAKDKLAYQDAKIKEQDSIIETLLAQSEYYKSKYKE